MKWLITFLFLFTFVNAEEITTGNLITNGNFETGNANGWNTSGDVQVLNDCCELNGVASNYDLEFGDNGSVEQDFNLSTNTIAGLPASSTAIVYATGGTYPGAASIETVTTPRGVTLGATFLVTTDGAGAVTSVTVVNQGPNVGVAAQTIEFSLASLNLG